MTRPDYCPVAQEPCQAMCAISNVRCKIRDTHPQQKREWVGLSEDEVATLMMEAWGCASIAPQSAPRFARAIEAKLKDKNT